jgi:hypothetical protein
METAFSASVDDSITSLRDIFPWITLNPAFSSFTSAEQLTTSAGPSDALNFLHHLDLNDKTPASVDDWQALFDVLSSKLSSSCSCGPPQLALSDISESGRWLKFFQLALIHAVHCEERVAHIEAIRSKLPDSVQRELMNQISQLQQEFQEIDQRDTNPSPVSFASILGESYDLLNFINSLIVCDLSR